MRRAVRDYKYEVNEGRMTEECNQYLAQLQKESRRNPNIPVIPASQLAAARREIEEAQRETASAQKSMRRLKEVWAAKSQELKEAIFKDETLHLRILRYEVSLDSLPHGSERLTLRP